MARHDEEFAGRRQGIRVFERIWLCRHRHGNLASRTRPRIHLAYLRKAARRSAAVSQGWLINGDDTDNAEYIVGIEWISTRDPSNAVRPSGVALRGTAVRIYGQDRAAELVAAFGVSAQTSE